MKNLLHRFAAWLWKKTYEPTATEILIRKSIFLDRYKMNSATVSLYNKKRKDTEVAHKRLIKHINELDEINKL